MKKQQGFKTDKAKIWVVGGKEFTNKRAAYRHKRCLDGTKTGGRSRYTVERKNAK